MAIEQLVLLRRPHLPLMMSAPIHDELAVDARRFILHQGIYSNRRNGNVQILLPSEYADYVFVFSRNWQNRTLTRFSFRCERCQRVGHSCCISVHMLHDASFQIAKPHGQHVTEHRCLPIPFDAAIHLAA